MDYKPGLVTASLNQGKKKYQDKTINPLLAKLFSKEKEKKKIKNKKKELSASIQNGEEPKPQMLGNTERRNEAMKRKAESLITTKATKKSKTDASLNVSNLPSQKQDSNPPSNFPYVHESLSKKSSNSNPESQSKASKKKERLKKKFDDEEDIENPSRRKRRHRDKTADKRTVFIGNCPLSTDKKIIKKLFKDFGPIENIRFRCGPPAVLGLPKKAIIIKKKFHENAQSYVCFVVFKEESSAQSALKMNGHVLDEKHLRVDLASNHNKHDKKKSIFVGNLPLDISEEEMRSHFKDCGTIDNVRIVRERKTSIGKGIAYVQFESKDGVMLAKRLNETELKGRKLRVMSCMNKPVKKEDPKSNNDNKKKSLSKTDTKPKKNRIGFGPTETKPKKKRIGFGPSNAKSKKDFQEILKQKREKHLKKKNKKRPRTSKKSDGLSHIFGDMSADVKKLKDDNPRLRTKKPKNIKKGKKEKKNNRFKKTSR